MAESANVESIDALVAIRIALVKFQEASISAMGDGESDVNRTINWLENDQFSFWSTQIRQRQEAVGRAQEALRQKTVFKDASGRTPSAVEEQKALLKAQQRLNEAQEKMAATKSWAKKLQKEMLLYKGQMQRFQTSVSSDIPAAIAHLGMLVTALQEYAALNPGAETTTIDPAMAAYFTEAGGGASMARGQAPDSSDPAAKKEEPAAAAPSPPPAEQPPQKEQA